jgi:hypothetical protein
VVGKLNKTFSPNVAESPIQGRVYGLKVFSDLPTTIVVIAFVFDYIQKTNHKTTSLALIP